MCEEGENRERRELCNEFWFDLGLVCASRRRWEGFK